MPTSKTNADTKVIPSATTPNDAAKVKQAVTIGKDLTKKGDVTKAEVARQMFEIIGGEPREVIVAAFVEGASLTPKGAQTYFYNCKRKAAATAR